MLRVLGRAIVRAGDCPSRPVSGPQRMQIYYGPPGPTIAQPSATDPPLYSPIWMKLPMAGSVSSAVPASQIQSETTVESSLAPMKRS